LVNILNSYFNFPLTRPDTETTVFFVMGFFRSNLSATNPDTSLKNDRKTQQKQENLMPKTHKSYSTRPVIPTDCEGKPLVSPMVISMSPWAPGKAALTHQVRVPLTLESASAMEEILAVRRRQLGIPTLALTHVIREAFALYCILHREPARKRALASLPPVHAPAHTGLDAPRAWWATFDTAAAASRRLKMGYTNPGHYFAALVIKAKHFLDTHPADTLAHRVVVPPTDVRYTHDIVTRDYSVQMSREHLDWLLALADRHSTTVALIIPRLEVLSRARKLYLALE
jgi:hypothetical protein